MINLCLLTLLPCRELLTPVFLCYGFYKCWTLWFTSMFMFWFPIAYLLLWILVDSYKLYTLTISPQTTILFFSCITFFGFIYSPFLFSFLRLAFLVLSLILRETSCTQSILCLSFGHIHSLNWMSLVGLLVHLYLARLIFALWSWAHYRLWEAFDFFIHILYCLDDLLLSHRGPSTSRLATSLYEGKLALELITCTIERFLLNFLYLCDLFYILCIWFIVKTQTWACNFLQRRGEANPSLGTKIALFEWFCLKRQNWCCMSSPQITLSGWLSCFDVTEFFCFDNIHALNLPHNQIVQVLPPFCCCFCRWNIVC